MSPNRSRGPRYLVRGGAALHGTVRISGAKNHALAAMCAALLTDDDVVLTNVPDLSDTRSIVELLASLGAEVDYRAGESLRINARGVRTVEAPTARRGCDCPLGVERMPRTAWQKENDRRVATRRSLEGLGYLGMLSALPTDMGTSLLQQAEDRQQQSAAGNIPVCSVPGPLHQRKADHAAVGTIRLGVRLSTDASRLRAARVPG